MTTVTDQLAHRRAVDPALDPPVDPTVDPADAPQRTDPTAGTPLLEVRDLQVRFEQYDRGLRRRTVTAVEAMTLEVRAGEVVALVGASGAGKSVLGHAVLGMLPDNARESGEVRWCGRPVDPAGRRRLAGRSTALLPQSLSHLDPSATVGAQLRRAARLAGAGRRERRELAASALREQGLEAAVLRRYPHQLSGGMGRRVLTALALMGDPRLVIADEPTPGLSPERVRSVLARLRAIAGPERGVLLITHDLGPAVEVADRVVVARDGRTVESVPADAFADPDRRLAHPYSRALWRALPENDFAVPREAAC